MDEKPPGPAPAEYDMPCCCAKCGAAFEPRTQRQLKMLARMADLGLELAEAVMAFPILTRSLGANDSYHYEVLTRGVRRSLALECKLTEDARKRHQREAHGAPAAREPQPGGRPANRLRLVTTEDVESVIAPEPVVAERPENLLDDANEALLDRFVDDHTPVVVVASICRDLEIEEDISDFLEPVPTRDDPWVQAEAAAVKAADVPEVPEAGEPDTPPPVAKGRDPP